MYTIFVNEKPIYLSDAPLENEIKTFKFETDNIFDEALNLLKNTNLQEVCIYNPNIEQLWEAFQNHFKIITAAGGLVKNSEAKVLLIKRFDKWDLPKGKTEKTDENLEKTALREVEEECNLMQLSILKKLPTTYHIYEANHPILKVVYWFEMYCDQPNPILIPQMEEGIQEVIWMDKTAIAQAMQNSYENIKLLLANYL